MKLIIAGSRDYTNYLLLKAKVDHLLQGIDPELITIVSGGARGADKLGERYAVSNKLRLKRFIPKWKNPDGTTNRAAGYVRNCEMANYATHLIAFWDGESKGTKHMIACAESNGLTVRVITLYSNNLANNLAIKDKVEENKC